MRAVHNLDFSLNRGHREEPMTDAQRKAVLSVEQPVLRIHPERGRKAIYLGGHAESIVGMGYHEGREIIDGVNDQSSPSAGPISTAGARATSWPATSAA